MKLILILLISVCLYAQDTKMPEWILKDPDHQGVYFRGFSAWYVTEDARMEALAYDDAVKNAYASVSDFFGLQVESSFEVQKQQKNTQTYTSTKSSIKTKTNQLIFDLKPIKKHIEMNEDESNFRMHVLILLDQETQGKIRQEMLQDEAELEILKKEVLSLIEAKDYFKAQNILQLAKGKRSAFADNSLQKIQNRLDALIKGMISATMQINKKVYRPDEEISLEVSLNQKGYLYLFYETSTDVEMFFPNQYQRSAYVAKEQLITFPNEEINLVAYEEDKGKAVRFFAIASTKNLALKSLAKESVGGVYLFDKEGAFLEMIESCISQGECSKKSLDFEINNTLSSEAVVLELLAEKGLQRKMIEFFQSKGISTAQSEKKLRFSIEKQLRYSKALNIDIGVYEIKTEFYENGKLIAALCEESSEDELPELLYQIYHELVFK